MLNAALPDLQTETSRTTEVAHLRLRHLKASP
jgi:hypothetical protein